MSKVIIRDFKESDQAFIMLSWAKSSYASMSKPKEKYTTYHNGLHGVVKRKHEQSQITVMVACLDNDPDFILGFGVFGMDYTLHFVFVRESCRKAGICKLLLRSFYKGRDKITVSFWNKNIQYIEKMFHVELNRFKLYL